MSVSFEGESRVSVADTVRNRPCVNTCFISEEAARRRLTTPRPSFGQKTPLEVLDTVAGYQPAHR